MSAPRTPEERLVAHTRTRIVVLEDLKVAFLPMPKSGCTSMLWTLAALAGHTRDDFTHSHQPEISRSMAVHNMRRWRPAERWSHRTPEDRARIVGADDWLRFTIVRDPVPRLWSAWQSKLLLQEPRFVERFSTQPWFPHRASTVDEVVDAFRAFVRALDTGAEQAPHDAHWGPQTGLMAEYPTVWVVGRADRPADNLALLRDHLAAIGADPTQVVSDVPRENANPLPFHPSVYDDETAAITARLFAGDRALADFPEPATDRSSGAEEWRALAADRLLLVNELVERHLRIGELLTELENEKAAVKALRSSDAAAEPGGARASLGRMARRIGGRS